MSAARPYGPEEDVNKRVARKVRRQMQQRPPSSVAARSSAATKHRPERISVCTCGAPLIATFHWRAKEWACIECGRLYGFLDATSVETTDALWDRYEELFAEWMEHAGPRLLTPGSKLRDCPKCWGVGGEDHEWHATDEEREAHKDAVAWLEARTAA